MRTQALIVSSDPAVELEFKDVIAATSAQISEVQKSMEGMALSEQDRAQMAKIAAARKTMTELRAQARAAQGRWPGRAGRALVKVLQQPRGVCLSADVGRLCADAAAPCRRPWRR